MEAEVGLHAFEGLAFGFGVDDEDGEELDDARSAQDDTSDRSSERARNVHIPSRCGTDRHQRQLPAR